MDSRLLSLVLLVAVGFVVARPDRQQQAVSYAHVVRDHGTPTPYRVNTGYPSHVSQVTHSHNDHLYNQQPYSLQQSYPLSYDSNPVKYPLAAPSYEGKGYQTYEAQSEERDEEEADYSGSAEHDY